MNRALIAAAVLAAGLVSGGMLIQGGSVRVDAAEPTSPRLFEQVVARLRRDYIDSLSSEQMLRLAASGVVSETDERYSVLLTPERVRRMKENASGRPASVGIEVDIRDGFVTVIAPIDGSPADSAGIKPGDRIISIDGTSPYRLTMEEVQQALSGPVGKPVRLTIDRDDGSRTVTLSRRMIVSHPVRRVQQLAPGIRYVQMATVNEQAAPELRRAIESGGVPSSLILDLRSNPGGTLDQGVAVAEMFLDPGQKIASTRGRTPDVNREFSDGSKQPWPALPVVVLVDSGTASAAEVIAGALQDNGRGVVLGSETYGKGSSQTLLPLNGGYALELTTSRWVTPKGRVIERDSTSGGIEPDVLVKRDAGKPAASDPDVQRAIQLLTGITTPAELRARVPAKPKKKD